MGAKEVLLLQRRESQIVSLYPVGQRMTEALMQELAQPKAVHKEEACLFWYSLPIQMNRQYYCSLCLALDKPMVPEDRQLLLFMSELAGLLAELYQLREFQQQHKEANPSQHVPDLQRLQQLQRLNLRLQRQLKQRDELEREMQLDAQRDPLTQLANRTLFLHRLDHALKHYKRYPEDGFAVLLIDLVSLRQVNEQYGDELGDLLLKQVTDLLQHCVRSRDTLARLGGDEFGVILEHCTAEQAQRVAQKICDQMEEFRFVHDGRRFRIGTSIGLVPLDKRWATTAAMMQAADTSCYAAKEAGRNRVHAWFDTDQAMQARKGEMQWATRIEQALDENRFVLYGQRIDPILPNQDGLRCEVLIRLRDDDGSIIPPGAFLPAAERFHLAIRIDRWVVKHVLDLLQTRARDLSHVHSLSVNLSGQSLGDPSFQQYLINHLTTPGLAVNKLCFEITETAAITKLGEASHFVEQIRRLGVRLALDDFGSGSSSFGYLKALAVDYLKIDGQFIKDVVHDPLDRAAVRCFCDVAHVMGLKTVGEFVDSMAVLQELQALGVDYAQGYLCHKPEPLEALLGLTPAPQRAVNA